MHHHHHSRCRSEISFVCALKSWSILFLGSSQLIKETNMAEISWPAGCCKVTCYGQSSLTDLACPYRRGLQMIPVGFFLKIVINAFMHDEAAPHSWRHDGGPSTTGARETRTNNRTAIGWVLQALFVGGVSEGGSVVDALVRDVVVDDGASSRHECWGRGCRINDKADDNGNDCMQYVERSFSATVIICHYSRTACRDKVR